MPGIAQEAVAIGADALWCQFGVINAEGARIAEEGGVTVVMDRCLKVEHARYVGRMHWLGFKPPPPPSTRLQPRDRGPPPPPPPVPVHHHPQPDRGAAAAPVRVVGDRPGAARLGVGLLVADVAEHEVQQGPRGHPDQPVVEAAADSAATRASYGARAPRPKALTVATSSAPSR